MRALLLVLAVAGCGFGGRDCSLGVRLEAHSAERAEFRRALAPSVYRIRCPSTHPEILIPQENHVSALRARLFERIRASVLARDLREVERSAAEAERNVSVDCLGTRWSGEEHVRAGRAALAAEERRLREIEARLEHLARRLTRC